MKSVGLCVGFSLIIIKLSEGYHKNNTYDGYNQEIENTIPAKGSRFLCVVLGICSAYMPPVFTAKPNLDMVYQWSQLEFEYSSDFERQADIDAGNYIPGKPAPIDTDVFYSPDNLNNKIFVSIPRFQSGVPATLGTVSSKRHKGNPVLTPYPSWQWHRNPSACAYERIVSVYRVMVDECDRLWVLDTGRLLETQTCPPQILAFDLTTNQLVHKHEIPSTLLEDRTLLVTPVVDVRDHQCADTFVYMADCQGFSIFVHEMRTKKTWKATDKTMYPYPNYGTFSIKGDSFDLMDGVLGMSLAPYVPGKDRKLFYHAMSSPTENWVYTSYLRNETLFIHDPSSSPEIFHTYRGERRTQSAAEAIDRNGVMFYGLMSEIKIACWNTRGEYADMSSTDTVAFDPVTLQFASGIKIVRTRKSVQELWIMTSRFQKIATDTLSTSETNFRISAGKVEDLTFGSTCEGKKFSGNSIGNHGGGGGGGYRLVISSGMMMHG